MSRPIPKTFFCPQWTTRIPFVSACGIWAWAVVTNCCTLWQTSMLTTALVHVVTFVECSVFLRADIVPFQAIFVLTRRHDLSTTADIPALLFGLAHPISSPSSVPFPSVLNSLTGNGLLYLTLNSQHGQTVHLSFCLSFSMRQMTATVCFFHLSQSFWTIWWVVKIMQQIKWKQHEGETHSRLHRETC